MATVNLEISSVVSNNFTTTIAFAAADDGSQAKAGALRQTGIVAMNNA